MWDAHPVLLSHFFPNVFLAFRFYSFFLFFFFFFGFYAFGLDNDSCVRVRSAQGTLPTEGKSYGPSRQGCVEAQRARRRARRPGGRGGVSDGGILPRTPSAFFYRCCDRCCSLLFSRARTFLHRHCPRSPRADGSRQTSRRPASSGRAGAGGSRRPRPRTPSKLSRIP